MGTKIYENEVKIKFYQMKNIVFNFVSLLQ